MRKTVLLFLTLTTITTPLLFGCGATNQTKGAGIGAVAGAAIGAAIGDKPGREKEYGAIGAIAGGVLGSIIGQRMDQQAKDLEKVPGVETVSVNQETQKIETQMNVLFDTDKHNVKPSEAAKLDQLANVFAKYPENIVVIEGHTDSDGSDQHNQILSENRAAAIETYLRDKNLNIASISSAGYGESRPVAPNDAPANKAKNRRVEIKISVDQSRVPQQQPTTTP
jgi:outer membrane protein OmpA-like peptidoglycan-associated protein